MNVTQWHGCYSGSWQGILVPDAFAHPAKVAPGLSYRIYRYMLDEGYIQPGDGIIDPFGGIGGFGYHAMLLGLHWTGVELEPRFVELGQRNIDKWRRDLAMLNGTLGTARLLQGDSRRLVEVVSGGMAAAISSPPYDSNTVHSDTRAGERHSEKGGQLGRWGMHLNGVSIQGDYGSTPGQLGAMPSGDYAAAVSSPPYADAVNGTGEGPGARHDPIHHKGDNAYKQSSNNGYGDTAGQLGRLSGDGFAAAVSSPPYTGDALGHDAGCVRLDGREDARRDTEGAYRRPGYGTTAGNLGNMRDGGFEAAVSSPPFGGEAQHTGGPMPTKHYDGRQAPRVSSGMVTGAAPYGVSKGQLAQEDGDTFWAAARAIVEQTYAALRPGGVAVWVTKDFVRKGQRVPFSDQWEALCAEVGFAPVERIHAMLVEEHGEQLDIFGNGHARRKERKSFFRRLAEKKGSPRIDHEDVLILRKPVTE